MYSVIRATHVQRSQKEFLQALKNNEDEMIDKLKNVKPVDEHFDNKNHSISDNLKLNNLSMQIFQNSIFISGSKVKKQFDNLILRWRSVKALGQRETESISQMVTRSKYLTHVGTLATVLGNRSIWHNLIT
jgi:hypothetical protein